MAVKIPIGIDDFREMRGEGYTFIDKSLFVRDVVLHPSKVLLLPRPRRFGKTLNLSMLRCFVDRAAEDARALFDGLALSREGGAAWEHASRYPVIALTFKEARTATWEMTYAILCDRIQLAFAKHREVAEGGKLDPMDAVFFRRMLEGAAAPVDYALSLSYLSRALRAHYGAKVAILIDEYDAPIHAAYMGGYLPQAIDFIRTFLGEGLKENPHLWKGVLTGILRVARENIFSGLNNLDVYTLLDEQFRSAFGFTEPEVKGFLDLAERSGDLEIVRRWYNGYLFGGEVIYNPWSVLHFVGRGGEPAAYWLNSSSNELVKNLLLRHAAAVANEIATLLSGGTIERHLEDALSLADLERRQDALWSLLVFSGYLKAQLAASVPPLETATHRLSIPNQEIREIYLRTFVDRLKEILERRGASLADLESALLAGDAAALEAQIGAFAAETLSYHDTASGEPELFYHGLLLGLTAALAADFEVRSNRETGKGRADMLFRPRRPGSPGVVLELKVARSKAGIARALAEGMRQIEEKGYASEMASLGVSPIRCVVVAFEGKTVRVKTRDAGTAPKPRPRRATSRKEPAAKPSRAAPKKRATSGRARPTGGSARRTPARKK